MEVRRRRRITLVALLALLGLSVASWAVSTRHPATRVTSTAVGLPEAVGPSTSPLVVVGLGDSVPAGSACGCTNYVSLVGRTLATTHRTVSVRNFATPGQTTAGLTRQIVSAQVSRALSQAQLVIVTIGANDVEDDPNCDISRSTDCYDDDVTIVRANYNTMMNTLRGVTSSAARIVVTGYWNVFRDGAVAASRGPSYVRDATLLTKEINQIIATAAAPMTSVTFVDLYRPFKGDGDRDDTALLAADGDHPSAAGHRLIAATITAALNAFPSSSMA